MIDPLSGLFVVESNSHLEITAGVQFQILPIHGCVAALDKIPTEVADDWPDENHEANGDESNCSQHSDDGPGFA